jgi:DNA repair exonuclease SbcCD ATPase subunit
MNEMMKLRKVELNNYWDFTGKYTIDFRIKPDKNITYIYGQCLSGTDTLFKGIRWCLTGSGNGKYYTPWSMCNNELDLLDYPEAYETAPVKAYLRFEKNSETMRVGRTAKPVNYGEMSASRVKNHRLSVVKWRSGERQNIRDPEAYLEEHFNLDALELFNIDQTLISSFGKQGARKSHVKTALQSIGHESNEVDKPLVERFTERINKHFLSLYYGKGDCPVVIITKGYDITLSSSGKRMKWDSLSIGEKVGVVFSFLIAFWEMSSLDQPLILFEPFTHLTDQCLSNVAELLKEVSLRRQMILFSKRTEIVVPVLRDRVCSFVGMYYMISSEAEGADRYKNIRIDKIW